MTHGHPFTVVVCTRDRPEHLHPTLDALEAQGGPFGMLVVDQSQDEDAALRRRASEHGRIHVVRDPGRGLSRARNVAWPLVETDWVVYVDDDCIVGEGWANALATELRSRPDVDFVSGHVAAPLPLEAEHLPVTSFPVERERVRYGRPTRPWAIGFGVFMAVRRSTIERLGGWDERLGAGTSEFPAAEDMDFNYRLLRSGGAALATPSVRVEHRQWRRRDELGPLFEGYMRGWCGFAMKTLKTTSTVDGVRLWARGVGDVARTVAGAGRRRSRLLLRVSAHRARGLASGTLRGLRRRW